MGCEEQVGYPEGYKLGGKAAPTAWRVGLSQRVEALGELEPVSGRARRGAALDGRGPDGTAAGDGGGPCLQPQVEEGNGTSTGRVRKSLRSHRRETPGRLFQVPSDEGVGKLVRKANV